MQRAVGVVVPAFRPDVEQLSAYVRALDERLDIAAIRIELDNPDPGVLDALEGLPAEVHAVDRRRGKGAAVTAGFEALETDVLAFADADGSTPVDSLSAVIDPVDADEADLAVGSRRHPDATVTSHQTVLRRFLGDAFAWLARRLLEAKLYDYQCGAKALSRGTWMAVRGHLHEPGFAWDIELVAVAAALDRRIKEVPVVWEDQPGSTVSPVGDTLAMFRGLLAARHRARLIREDPLHELLEAGEEGRALVNRDAEGEGEEEGADRP